MYRVSLWCVLYDVNELNVSIDVNVRASGAQQSLVIIFISQEANVQEIEGGLISPRFVWSEAEG